MASYMLNALTLRHDHDAAERTLHHFWDTKDLLDSSLIEEHIASQPLLAASLFCLISCSFGLIVFAIVFLTCRFRGQCGSQKYQEYPSNSTNYAIYLMLFFISWLIVTAASAYFILAGIGFWSERLDARKPFSNASSLVRLSRSTVGDLFANYDYQGDFESVSEVPRGLKRVHINRKPAIQTFRKRIEIPLRPLAEVTFSGTSDKFITKNRPMPEPEPEEENRVTNFPSEEEIHNRVEESSGVPGRIAEIFGNEEEEGAGSEEEDPGSLVVTGETMTVEEDSEEEEEDTVILETTVIPATSTTVPTVPPVTSPPTTVPTTTTVPSTTTVPPTTSTTVLPTTVPPTTSSDILDQLLSHAESTADSPYQDTTVNPHLPYFSLHSRFLIFICRLTFCLVSLCLLTLVLPTFFLVVAGTGCYIYSDHPMNRSSVSNKIGKAVSINASILLFLCPLMLLFSSFTLFYTHSHELLCATIQLQYQQSRGLIDYSIDHQSLIENYSFNSSQCSRSLAPIQSLLLSSLLLCVSLLPMLFSLFKLVKFYFRMSSEFYWNAADNYAGRHYSKQQEFPRYQSTVIYPDDEIAATQGGYAVYGQI